jgi:hypothetical protein
MSTGVSLQRDSRPIFGLRHYVLIELAAFCQDDNVILDVVRELLPLGLEDEISKDAICKLVAESKARAIERLGLLQRPGSAISRFLAGFARKYHIESGTAELLRVFCQSLANLEQPCEYMLIYYFVKDSDAQVVPNHWIVRANCQQRLGEAMIRAING